MIAALWRSFIFTVPLAFPPVTAYQVQRVTPESTFIANIYEQPNSTPNLVSIASGGARDTLYISHSEDGRPRLYRLRTFNGAWSPWSNGIVIAAGLAAGETYFYRETAPQRFISTWLWWEQLDGDLGTLESLPAIQHRLSPRICELFPSIQIVPYTTDTCVVK